MPYKCTLTSENLKITLDGIRGLYRKIVKFKDKDYAVYFIAQIYELFCQGIFINQEIDIHWKLVEKNMNLTKSASTLIHIIKQIRDAHVHDIVNGKEKIEKYIMAIDVATLENDCIAITEKFYDTDGSVARMLMNAILFCASGNIENSESNCDNNNKRELGFELNFDFTPIKRKED